MFLLTGFLNYMISTPSFLVPIFNREGTNQFFVQILDSKYNIIAFAPYEIADCHDICIMPAEKGIQKSKGDNGILSYLFQEGDIIFGCEKTVKFMLEARLRDLQGAPFAYLEAARFLGNFDRIEAAIIGACVEFSRIDTANGWAVRELEMARRQRSSDAIRVHDLDEVRGSDATGASLIRVAYTQTAQLTEDFAILADDDHQQTVTLGGRWIDSWLRMFLIMKNNIEFLQKGEAWLSHIGNIHDRKWRAVWTKFYINKNEYILKAVCDKLYDNAEISNEQSLLMWLFYAKKGDHINDLESRTDFVKRGFQVWSRTKFDGSGGNRLWLAVARQLLKLDRMEFPIAIRMMNILRRGDIDQSQWSSLWPLLINQNIEYDELINMGYNRLLSIKDRGRHWEMLWMRIMNCTIHVENGDVNFMRSSLYNIGLAHLNVSTDFSNRWAKMCLMLFKINQSDEQLRRISAIYLQNASKSSKYYKEIISVWRGSWA